MGSIFMPIFFILVAGGLFFTYIDPTYKSVSTLRVENDRYDQALTKAKDLQKARDDLLSRYNTFSATDLERLQKMLPDNIDNVRLVLDISNIAKQHNLEIKDFSFSGDSDSSSDGSSSASTKSPQGVGTQSPTASSQSGAFSPDDTTLTGGAVGGETQTTRVKKIDYRSVGMDFSVEAGYDEFIVFMNDLERSLRVVDIQKLDIDPADDGLYTFDIGINTYWLP